MSDPVADIIMKQIFEYHAMITRQELPNSTIMSNDAAKQIRQQIGRELLGQIDLLLKGNPNGLVNYGIGMSEPAIREVCQLEEE